MWITLNVPVDDASGKYSLDGVIDQVGQALESLPPEFKIGNISAQAPYTKEKTSMAGIPTQRLVEKSPAGRKPPTRKYRLVMGQHVQTDADGVERAYYAGSGGHDIFETHVDMLRMNGGGGMQPKFELVGDGNFSPSQGAVWDPSKESIDQFSARMKVATHEQEQAKLQAELEAQQTPATAPTTVIPPVAPKAPVKK